MSLCRCESDMPLRDLHIEGVRCIKRLHLQADARWNWLVGPNGAGKSSVLEAIHTLGTGQSWRRGLRHLRRDGCQEYLITAHLAQDPADALIALRRNGEERDIRYDGKSIDSAWSLLDILPIQTLNDQNVHFISDNNESRRRILDWGVFYENQAYGQILRDYRRLLQQRNAWLKSKYSAQPWDAQLAVMGEQVQQHRQTHLSALQPLAGQLWQEWTQSPGQLQVSLQPGWKEDLSLLACLTHDRQRDEDFGFTHSGPHRANLIFKVAGKPVADILSRGQLRLLGLSYRLAQLALLQQRTQVAPVVLMDDFAAELDRQARRWLVERLDALALQVFAAVTDSEQIPHGHHGHRFHLREGHLIEGIAA